jgi:hypothetical protein
MGSPQAGAQNRGGGSGVMAQGDPFEACKQAGESMHRGEVNYLANRRWKLPVILENRRAKTC